MVKKIYYNAAIDLRKKLLPVFISTSYIFLHFLFHFAVHGPLEILLLLLHYNCGRASAAAFL